MFARDEGKREMKRGKKTLSWSVVWLFVFLSGACLFTWGLAPSALAVESEQALNTLHVEARKTDIFAEPVDPAAVRPPPDGIGLAYLYLQLDSEDALAMQAEYYHFKRNPAELLFLGEWYHQYQGRRFSPGALIRANEAGDRGGALSFEAALDLGPNATGALRAELHRTPGNKWAGRLETRLDPWVVTPTTHAEARLWVYKEEYEFWSTSADVNVLQFITEVVDPLEGIEERLALQAWFRRYDNFTGWWSMVEVVGLRAQVSRRTFLRASYRWYQDSNKITGDGPSVGVERAFTANFTASFDYRYYTTSERQGYDTFWLSAEMRF